LRALGEEFELGEEVTYSTSFVVEAVEPREAGGYWVRIKPFAGKSDQSVVRLERSDGSLPH